LKLLDIVSEIWDLLRKLFAPPSVPSWLRAWLQVRVNRISLHEWSGAGGTVQRNCAS